MSNTPKVHIVTVHYNSEEDILECWKSLSASTYENFQWIIVDNASSASSLQSLKTQLQVQIASFISLKNTNNLSQETKGAKVVLVENDQNEGFAAGNNLAIRELLKHNPTHFIWLLNPDVVLEPTVLEDLVTLGQKHTKSLLGNLIHYYHQKDEVMYCGGFQVLKCRHGVCDVKSKDEIYKIDAIAGASLFASIEAFSEIGLLPEKYFLYWEETHFCTVAQKKGYSFQVNTKSKIFDKVGSAANTSFTREYLYLLNGLRYYQTFYPWRMPVIFLTTLLKFVKSIITGPAIKRKALWYGNWDYIKTCFGVTPNIKKRISSH